MIFKVFINKYIYIAYKCYYVKCVIISIQRLEVEVK